MIGPTGLRAVVVCALALLAVAGLRIEHAHPVRRMSKYRDVLFGPFAATDGAQADPATALP